MPRIFDNIDQQLLPALRESLEVAERADFCVGYFNLRGWKAIDSYIEAWSGRDGNACRLLVGMQKDPDDEFRDAFLHHESADALDLQTVARLRRSYALRFREQLTIGTPTNEDERALRRLAEQLRARKVVVKLHVRHPLHEGLAGFSASRRFIIYSDSGGLRPYCRSIDHYKRDDLKNVLRAVVGRTWTDEEEAIRGGARYLGFRRTGAQIQKVFKSAIKGALRQGAAERNGAFIRFVN